MNREQRRAMSSGKFRRAKERMPSGVIFNTKYYTPNSLVQAKDGKVYQIRVYRGLNGKTYGPSVVRVK